MLVFFGLLSIVIAACTAGLIALAHDPWRHETSYRPVLWPLCAGLAMIAAHFLGWSPSW